MLIFPVKNKDIRTRILFIQKKLKKELFMSLFLISFMFWLLMFHLIRQPAGAFDSKNNTISMSVVVGLFGVLYLADQKNMALMGLFCTGAIMFSVYVLWLLGSIKDKAYLLLSLFPSSGVAVVTYCLHKAGILLSYSKNPIILQGLLVVFILQYIYFMNDVEEDEYATKTIHTDDTCNGISK